MLSSNAEGLYWIARYMQRADSVARILEVGYRMSMIPSASGGHSNEWEPLLMATGSSHLFYKRHDKVTQQNLEQFLLFDRDYPSSVYNCISKARQNAKAYRTALTSEVWDAINQAYIGLADFEQEKAKNLNLPVACDWIKMQYSLILGTFLNTQLQNEGYHFFNLGGYIERADSTARLLDVKYYVLLPTIDMVGGSVDSYQWSVILRAVSAWRAFHHSFGGEYVSQKIAHFMILYKSCPRALIHCVERLDLHLSSLARIHGVDSPAHEYTSKLLQELNNTDIDKIIDSGLHDFLTEFTIKLGKLNNKISDSYLFGRT